MFVFSTNHIKAMKRFTGHISALVENKQNEEREHKRLRLNDESGEQIQFSNGAQCSVHGDDLNASDDLKFCDAGDPHLKISTPAECSPIYVSSDLNTNDDLKFYDAGDSHLKISFSAECSSSYVSSDLNTNEDLKFCDAGNSHLKILTPTECSPTYVSSDLNHMYNAPSSITRSADVSLQTFSDAKDNSSVRGGVSVNILNDLNIVHNENVSTDGNSSIPPYSSESNTNSAQNALLHVNLQNDKYSEEQSMVRTESIISDMSKTTFKCDAENLVTSSLQVMSFEGHSDDVLCVLVDGDIIISASADTTVKVWNASEQNQLCSFRGHMASVTSVVLLSVEQTSILMGKMKLENISRVAVTGSLDCTCRLWSVPEGYEISSFYTYNGIICVKYLEVEMCAVIGTDGGKLEIWDLHSSKLIHSVFAHEDMISDICIDVSYVYTVSADGMIKVWLVEEGFLQLMYTRRRKEIGSDHMHFNPCLWKAVSTFQNMLYLADNSSYLKVLDWKSGKLKILQDEVCKIGEVDALCIYNNILVISTFHSNTSSGSIHVWLLPELRYLCSLLGTVQRIFSLALSETKEGTLRIVSAGVQLLMWEFDFSQPPSNRNESSFYCTTLEQVNVVTAVHPNSEISSQGDDKNSTLASVKNTSWGCNLI